MAIFDHGRGYNLSPAGTNQEAEQVSGLRVSASFFSVLGFEPFLGRTFLPEEETLGKDHEVVLSYGLWKRLYGGDPALVGRTITIDGQAFTVVGVMPRQFQWQFWNPSQLWVPMGYTKQDYQRDWNSFVVIGRLKPAVTMPQARAEIDAIANRLAQQYPVEDVGMGARAVPLNEFGREDLRTALPALLVAVGFVLLIACIYERASELPGLSAFPAYFPDSSTMYARAILGFSDLSHCCWRELPYLPLTPRTTGIEDRPDGSAQV